MASPLERPRIIRDTLNFAQIQGLEPIPPTFPRMPLPISRDRQTTEETRLVISIEALLACALVRVRLIEGFTDWMVSRGHERKMVSLSIGADLARELAPHPPNRIFLAHVFRATLIRFEPSQRYTVVAMLAHRMGVPPPEPPEPFAETIPLLEALYPHYHMTVYGWSTPRELMRMLGPLVTYFDDVLLSHHRRSAREYHEPQIRKPQASPSAYYATSTYVGDTVNALFEHPITLLTCVEDTLPLFFLNNLLKREKLPPIAHYTVPWTGGDAPFPGVWGEVSSRSYRAKLAMKQYVYPLTPTPLSSLTEMRSLLAR